MACGDRVLTVADLLDIDRLRELLATAEFPPPWDDLVQGEANRALAVAATNALPALLSYIQALETERDLWRGQTKALRAIQESEASPLRVRIEALEAERNDALARLDALIVATFKTSRLLAHAAGRAQSGIDMNTFYEARQRADEAAQETETGD
jgi:hypothetical protein